MTDAELLVLDGALSSPVFGGLAMGVCSVEGFVTALVIGPRLIAPSKWLPWVWDENAGLAEPEFASLALASAVTSEIMRLHNEVASVFTDATVSHFEPLYLRTPEQWRASDWCKGFHIGMRLAYKDWSPLLMGAPTLFAPFLTLGDDEGADRSREQSAEQIRALEDAIVPNLRMIAAHWRAAGSFAPSGPAPVRRDGPKLGRNDPCPCGSGLKYKKCHGLNRLID